MRQRSIRDAFEGIYKANVWGYEKPSGPGSYGRWAEEYVSFIRVFVDTHGVKSIYDAGCGDFNVGSQIAPAVDRYVAADISETILRRNRKAFKSLGNVEFRQANICEDAIEPVDLVTVRQVFQHLTNKQIELALRNIEAAKPRFLVVAEQIFRPEAIRAPNVDLESHSIGTRVKLNSGVLLGAPPFSRRASIAKTIAMDASVGGESDTVLAIQIVAT